MSDEQQRDIPDDLEARFASMEENEAEDLRAVWALLGEADADSDLDADPDAAWNRVRAHIHASSPPEATDREAVAHGRHVVAGRTVRVVAGVLLAVLVGGALLWQRPVEVTAPRGEQQSVTLPDGSTVQLNSGTRLQYQRGFAVLPFWEADRRTVDLQGEAFFDVADAGRSFVVETSNARVEVVGTQFNVRARLRDGDPHTEVALVSGRVRLASRANRTPSVTLKDGEAARIRGAASPTAPRDTSVERVLAWRRGGFSVVDRPVRQVAAALERRFDTTIDVADDVPAHPVTLYYRTQTDVETILGDMCEALNMKFRTTSRGYLLSRSDE